MPSAASGSGIRFFVNGREWRIDRPDPRTLLVDWLRSPAVGLTGTKIGCGQGGCGLCTVMLSRWDPGTGKVIHESINSCLRPLCSIDGMAITTTEGAGSVETGLNPVQHRIAIDNGSQCGFCTPGWVMTMTAYLAAHRDRKPTQLEIEQLFDGNLCRCTGYRPILYAMRHFASDWTPADEHGSMKCLASPDAAVIDSIAAPTPPADAKAPLTIVGDDCIWHRPVDLKGLLTLLHDLDPAETMLVNGNSSIGIYDRYDERPTQMVDISRLPELRHFAVEPAGLQLGAGATYADLLAFLDALPNDQRGNATVAALRYMAERTAGHIVRNVASLAGNTMLVARHVANGVPFPSDLFTALCAAGAEVEFALPGHRSKRLPVLEFAALWSGDAAPHRAVLLAYHVPLARAAEYVQTYKVALREVNAHSIVNAGMRVRFDEAGLVAECAIVLGGIAPIAFHAEAAEAALIGRGWTAEALAEALAGLRADITGQQAKWARRMAGLPDEGFTDSYRLHLAESYLYKFFIEVAEQAKALPIPAGIASAGQRPVRPLSRGKQFVPPNIDPPPVGMPYVKQDAFLQASGEAVYTQDIALPPRGLESAFVLSDRATGSFFFQLPDAPGTPVTAAALSQWLAANLPGVERLVTAADVPHGENNRVPAAVASEVGGIDPLFAETSVEWYGQPIALLLAETWTQAIDAAHFVRTRCIGYSYVSAPLLTIDAARACGSELADTEVGGYNHILAIERPNSQLGWKGSSGPVTLDGANCVVINGTQVVGSQAHFYMETQSTVAFPGEWGRMEIFCSTQSPDTVQSFAASMLGSNVGKVDVQVRRVGGGYGGKTTRPPFIAAPVALAASITKRPVRLAMRREEDMEALGRRHAYEGNYSLAVATGEEGSVPRGRILGADITFWSNGGATYDCSFVVSDCVQMRIDSAYNVPNWRTEGHVARTNLATSTAFRSMGLIQGAIVLEDAIAAAAHSLGMLAEDLREVNLYQRGDETVVGSVLDICYMQQVWQYLRKNADFDARAEAVKAFNAANRWRKRGIAMIPVQYGAGYNATFLEQAGALVEVFGNDASILIHQGGVEIGQGLAVKIAQVAAQTLNVPLALITIADTDLGVVPNPVSTGASTGSGYNAEAVRAACLELSGRLRLYAAQLHEQHGDKWCQDEGIDYWNHQAQGWQTLAPNGRTMWSNLIGMAHGDRINLSAQVRVAIAGGDNPAKNLQFATPQTAEQGVDQFTGYTFSAGCAEVEIDVLTGETTVLRADLCYDIGDSLNPAVDIGQVEGAFVQGLGYVLTEELVTQPDGERAGRLNSNNTWGYKIPATTSIPLEMNVGFFPRGELNLPREIDVVMGSKEVGEPPLVLAATVFGAVKNAIVAARADRGHTEWFRTDGPLTVQRVREACLVEAADLTV